MKSEREVLFAASNRIHAENEPCLGRASQSPAIHTPASPPGRGPGKVGQKVQVASGLVYSAFPGIASKLSGRATSSDWSQSGRHATRPSGRILRIFPVKP